jgi:4-amino-4-deoxy-L-arabinose transferase-like glycosyltransferase
MSVTASVPRRARVALRTPRPQTVALVAITAVAGVLRLVSLGGSGTNPFYDAAVRSMGESWHNLFFAAFEPSAGVAIDKPPVDLWLQVASVKVLGWSTTALILPQAIAATAAVPVLYALVRRLFGVPAALLAAASLALMPVAVLTARSDTMDSVMMLLNVVAAWLAVRAAQTGRLRLLLAAAAVVGLNFEVKLFEALVALPALVLLYVLASPPPLRRSVRALAIATPLALAVALAWPVAVSLAPQQPYALGSTNGSVWNAIFVYNGTQRLNPPRYTAPPRPAAAPHPRSTPPPSAARPRAAHATATQGLLSGSGAAPGPLRLFERGGSRFGQNFGIELVAAIAFGGLALLLYAVAVLRRRVTVDRLPRAGAIAIAVWVLTGYVLFSRSRGVVYTRYLEAISPAVAAALGVGVVACARLARRSWRALAAVMAALAVTVAYAVVIADGDTTLKLVCIATAAAAAVAALVSRTRPAVAPLVPAALAATVLAPAAVRSHAIVTGHESDSGGAAGAEGSPLVRAESAFLRSHSSGTRYEVATYSFAPAAPLIVRDGRPVLVLTSYTSPVVSARRLAAAIRRDEVRYAIVGGSCGSGSPAGCPDVIRWLRRHATDVTARAGLPGSGVLFRLRA